MHTYICDSHRPAQAENEYEAAEIFAFRKARTEFGRCAKIGALKGKWIENEEMGEFEAFIGHSINEHAVSGHSVRFSVYRVTYQEEK